MNDLASIACALVSDGKGILAADESLPTIGKRFAAVGLESTEESRRAYRELLFTTPGLGEFISGVILFDETLRQNAADGRSLLQTLAERGILPGIKVDRGLAPLAGSPGEKVTEGLDGLRARLDEYRTLGARFAKWRAAIVIGPGLPTPRALKANAHALARYASLCQETGLTPIVEPEVLLDGDHSLERCEEVSTATLRTVFAELAEFGVALEGMLLKPSMALSGKNCARQAGVAEVAEATLRCLRRSVPAAMPGVVFLSGGQTPTQATNHLNAINRLGRQPWALSFSFARALQDPVLAAWRGDPRQASAAQRLLYQRARCNSVARHGEYSEQVEREIARSA